MKTCPRCGVEKPTTEFGLKSSAKDGRQVYCKSCRNSYAQTWYESNRKTHLKRVKTSNDRLRREVRSKILSYLQEHPCVDCGEADPIVLEFDHTDPDMKAGTISDMIRTRRSWEVISSEIAKCEVRCANCHRRRTAHQFSWWKFLTQE